MASRDHESPARPVFLIAGMPARDTKRFHDGRMSSALGGILFTVSSAAPLARMAGFDPVVVTTVGFDVADDVVSALVLSGCSTGGVRIVDAPTQHSEITFLDADVRRERVEGVLPPLVAADFVPWLGADVIALNFVTGAEMNLSTLRWLRDAFHGQIIMDYHTLALRTDDAGSRVPHRRDDWAAWIACADVVQMNRDEASTLAGVELASRDECMRFARDFVGLGPRAAVITLAGEGAVGVERSERGQRAVDSPAYPPTYLVDTVGCGDVFLGGLAVGWATWRELGSALTLATRAASVNCASEGCARAEEFSAVWNEVRSASV